MNLAARIVLLVAGHIVMAAGISLSIISDLGTTPITALPLVTSLITGVQVGITTIVVNAILVLLQILLLRRDYPPVQLVQLLILLYFGPLIDVALWVTRSLGVGYSSYWQQWVLTVAGIVLVGVGVVMQVRAKLFMLPGEGIAQALSFALHRAYGAKPQFEFGRVKVLTDIIQVSTALILALTFLGGFHGVREGTLAAALGVGWVVTLCNKLFPPKNRPHATDTSPVD